MRVTRRVAKVVFEGSLYSEEFVRETFQRALDQRFPGRGYRVVSVQMETIPNRPRSRAQRLSDAIASIQDGVQECRDLAEELESWRDGLSGTGLENAGIYDRLEEAIEALNQAADEIESQVSELESIEMPTPFSG
jgi:uncharacterized protein YukE